MAGAHQTILTQTLYLCKQKSFPRTEKNKFKKAACLEENNSIFEEDAPQLQFALLKIALFLNNIF